MYFTKDVKGFTVTEVKVNVQIRLEDDQMSKI